MKLTTFNLTRTQFQVLRFSQLFHGLTDEQLVATVSCWHLKKYCDSAVVLLEGQSGDSVFFIIEGRAKIYCSDREGREMVIGYKGSGEVLGEMGFIDGTVRSATVETVTPSILLWTDRDGFRESCKAMPMIFENLLKIATTQLRTTNTRMQILLAPSAHSRMARLLVQLAEQTDPATNTAVLPFKLSQVDIGNMINLSRASVNAVLAGWKQLEIISIDSQHTIAIKDHAALKREAE